MKALVIVLFGAAISVTALGQSYESEHSANKGKKKPPEKVVPLAKGQGQGVVQRMGRGGNPLQMLNPRAPARYGTAADSVVFDPDTGKLRGIKFFEVVF